MSLGMAINPVKDFFNASLKETASGLEKAYNSWLTYLSGLRVIHRDSDLGDLGDLLTLYTKLKSGHATEIFEKRSMEFFDENNDAHIQPLPQGARRFALIFDYNLENVFVRKMSDGSLSLPELQVRNDVVTISGVRGDFIRRKFRRVSYLDTTVEGVALRAHYFFNVLDQQIIYDDRLFEWEFFTNIEQPNSTATAELKKIMSVLVHLNKGAGVDYRDIEEHEDSFENDY